MFKPLTVVTVVFLTASTETVIHKHRDDYNFTTVNINMKELTNKRLNFVYATAGHHEIDNGYCDVFKSGEGRYTGVYRFFGTHNRESSMNSTVTAAGGILTHVFKDHGNGRADWHVLAKTSEGAMLVYAWFSNDRQELRFILVPSNNTLGEDTKFRRVPSEYLLSNDSLNQLLAVDRSYNFTTNLYKIPYAQQDFK